MRLKYCIVVICTLVRFKMAALYRRLVGLSVESNSCFAGLPHNSPRTPLHKVQENPRYYRPNPIVTCIAPIPLQNEASTRRECQLVWHLFETHGNRWSTRLFLFFSWTRSTISERRLVLFGEEIIAFSLLRFLSTVVVVAFLTSG